MSPSAQIRGRAIEAPNNLYTVILAAAFAVSISTAVFVGFMCYSQYETIFKIVGR